MTLTKHKLLPSVPYGVHEFQKGVVCNTVGTSTKTSNVAFDTTEMVRTPNGRIVLWSPRESGHVQGLLAVAQWLRFFATNWKVAGSIPADATGIFH